jgi:hypothetical protein
MKKTSLLLIQTIIFAFIFFSEYKAQIYITKLHDLEFGEVFMGYSAEVQHTDPNAAKFSFYHTRFFRRTVYIQFVLPSTLNNGSSQIPIIFDQAHTAISYNDQEDGRTNFDPHSIVYIRRLFFYRTVYIWLGGTITTSPNMQYGTYSGTIILNVFY